VLTFVNVEFAQTPVNAPVLTAKIAPPENADTKIKSLSGLMTNPLKSENAPTEIHEVIVQEAMLIFAILEDVGPNVAKTKSSDATMDWNEALFMLSSLPSMTSAADSSS
jgi:hypothetical protein